MTEKSHQHRVVGPAAREIVRDSLLAAALNAAPGDRWYLSAASLHDHTLWDNSSRQLSTVFPRTADKDAVRVSDLLTELSSRSELRVIVRDGDGILRLADASAASICVSRISADVTLPLGIFCATFACFASWSVNVGGLEAMDSAAEICLNDDAETARRISDALAILDENWPHLAEVAP